ncbi:16S rRNA (cytosine(967)-C(5))-methyltransferase RsmB [Halotalea alkalilenta]|uniref:16S rRNA (cytosine(967)-C(5))-methyltransferase RsmB n=1 Tax=Halotalea alkalilenta TaxID=376489 RepID=UPI000486B648|nr:16S rRNA (cytosine(967)-C(5))-methyltransferase RsmB [Halotalea alkalilenta]
MSASPREPNDPRAAAARALVPIIERRASLSSLDDGTLSGRDKGFFRALCFGVCRTLPRLEALAGMLLSQGFKPRDRDVQALLLIGLHQLLYMRVPNHAAVGETAGAARLLGKPWATKVLNACLRRCQREREALEARLDAERQSQLLHPAWLLDAIEHAWPDQAASIIAANNTAAPMTLRVNRARIRRDEYLARLEAEGLEARPCIDAEDGVTLANAVDALTLPGFKEGLVSVQDESAQLAAALLIDPLLASPTQAPLRVLDACSAPGGKSMQLIERAAAAGRELSLKSLDSDAQRLKRVEQGIARISPPESIAVDVIEADATQLDWWDGQRFDAILLDAPCSGTGVIRRHPDIKQLRLATDITQLAELQRRLLDSLWPTLRVGGRLLYATCSIMPAENQARIEDFLAHAGDARLVPIDASWGIETNGGARQRLPEVDGADGFFYALVEKTAD